MSSDGPGRDVITSRPVLPPPLPPFGRWRTGLRVAGLLAGIGAVLAVAPALRPTSGPPALPLTVTVEVTRAGEVGTFERTQLLPPTELIPRGTVTGTLPVVSHTGTPVDVSVTNVGPLSDVEEQVWARILLGSTVVHDGPLAELREGSSGSIRLEPSESADLRTDLSMINDADDSYQGRAADLDLQLTATRVED